METAPTLPDFSLALKPDEYQLPQVDSSWRTENIKVGQTDPNHLKGWQVTRYNEFAYLRNVGLLEKCHQPKGVFPILVNRKKQISLFEFFFFF